MTTAMEASTVGRVRRPPSTDLVSTSVQVAGSDPPYNCDAEFNLQFVPAGSDMAEDSDRALGLVDFALRVHLDREGFPDSSLTNIERWAAGIPVPTYAIDDETAIKVTEGTVEVVSEGQWKLLTPSPEAG
jgi:dipeptidase E